MTMYNVSLELRVSKLALLNMAIKKYTHDFHDININRWVYRKIYPK